jgi:hypothetical protein
VSGHYIEILMEVHDGECVPVYSDSRAENFQYEDQGRLVNLYSYTIVYLFINNESLLHYS